MISHGKPSSKLHTLFHSSTTIVLEIILMTIGAFLLIFSTSMTVNIYGDDVTEHCPLHARLTTPVRARCARTSEVDCSFLLLHFNTASDFEPPTSCPLRCVAHSTLYLIQIEPILNIVRRLSNHDCQQEETGAGVDVRRSGRPPSFRKVAARSIQRRYDCAWPS
jgi:hypothetical protein